MAINFVLRFEEKDLGFRTHFEESKQGFVTHFGEVVNAEYPLYEGEYEVTPKVVPQTLETANKSMASDVVVLEIPYYEVDNAFQGQTVIIGGS